MDESESIQLSNVVEAPTNTNRVKLAFYRSSKNSYVLRRRSRRVGFNHRFKVLVDSNPRNVILRVVIIVVVILLVFLSCLLIRLFLNPVTGTGSKTIGSIENAKTDTIPSKRANETSQLSTVSSSSYQSVPSSTANYWITTSASNGEERLTTSSPRVSNERTTRSLITDDTSTLSLRLANVSSTSSKRIAGKRTTDSPTTFPRATTILSSPITYRRTTTSLAPPNNSHRTTTTYLPSTAYERTAVSTTADWTTYENEESYGTTLTQTSDAKTAVSAETPSVQPTNATFLFDASAGTTRTAELIATTENAVTVSALRTTEQGGHAAQHTEISTVLSSSAHLTSNFIAISQNDLENEFYTAVSGPTESGNSATTQSKFSTPLTEEQTDAVIHRLKKFRIAPKIQTTETTRVQSHSPLVERSTSQEETLVDQEQRKSDVFFLDGPYTFREANQACERKGAIAATKFDLEEAWEVGFTRCIEGWLQDMHVAMASHSATCHCNENGVLYNKVQDPAETFEGVYCTNRNKDGLNNNQRVSIGSNVNSSINWWVTVDPKDAYDLQHILKSVTSTDEGEHKKFPLLESLNAIYICCNAFNITYTPGSNPTTYVRERHSSEFFEESIKTYRRVFEPAKILSHVYSNYKPMMMLGAATVNRTATIRQLVTRARQVGLDGLIMNYEPRENYTREHAQAYIDFLNQFYEAAKDSGLTLGTVISSWGILKHYDLFAKCKADFFGSMGSTYYGRDLARNKVNVNAMLKEIDVKRLRIGLGLMMQASVKNPKRNYRWTRGKLTKFLSWLRRRDIKQLHIFPGHWRHHRHAEQYFIDMLAKF